MLLGSILTMASPYVSNNSIKIKSNLSIQLYAWPFVHIYEVMSVLLKIIGSWGGFEESTNPCVVRLAGEVESLVNFRIDSKEINLP